jgi:NAD-dependent dihydropyrimidine dehydrogenase PreA subunit
MISVNESLCNGCGACVSECPTDAITLTDGRALVDANLCDGCGSLEEEHFRLCLHVCPVGALTWTVEPSPGAVTATALAVAEPSTELVPARSEPKPGVVVARPMTELAKRAPATPVLQRRALLPAVGGALVWFGSEIVPRLVPLALDALDRALDRPVGRPTRALSGASTRMGRGRSGRRQRRRHRGNK